MVRQCNPNNPKANNPKYICNHITGRWNIKKLKSKKKSCNPNNPKANNPNYYCNKKTNRWNLKKNNRSKKKNKRKIRVKEIDRSGYYAPVRNYRCMENLSNNEEDNIIRCSRDIKGLKIDSEIGRGSFGVVYKGSGIINNKRVPVAIKVIKDVDLNDIYDEVEYSYYMSETNIGPKMYDAFFYKQGNNYIQILIMEPFDMSVSNALDTLSKDKQKKIISKVIKLLEKQIYDYNLECLDIKPANFVYRKQGDIVRMIDFGRDWCTLNKSKSKKKKDMILLMMIVQFLIMCKEWTKIDHIAMKVALNNKIYKNRYNHIDDVDEVLKTDDHLYQIYDHYVKATDGDEFKDVLGELDDFMKI